MKKFLKSILLIWLVSFFMVGSALAFPITAGDTVQMNAGMGDNYGMLATDGNWYNTFCLEKDEYFSNDEFYFVESVGNVAVSGGINSVPNVSIVSVIENSTDTFTGWGDSVSQQTLWLYASYFNGVFDNLAVKGQDLINMVQYAIWYSEDEDNSYLNQYNSLTAFADPDFTITGWDIRAVNIVWGPDKDHQSQLVGAPVPEPATMMLFGMGLFGLSFLGRRKTK